MSRKHFQILADHQRETFGLYVGIAAYNRAVEMLAARLADENDRFDRAKFIAACKV